MTAEPTDLAKHRLDRTRASLDQAFADAYGEQPRTVLTIPQGTEPDCPREHGPMDPERPPHGASLGMARCPVCHDVAFYRHAAGSPGAGE